MPNSSDLLFFCTKACTTACTKWAENGQSANGNRL